MKVLVVEDDPLLKEMVRIKLKKDGFDVTTASNGEEGVRCAEDFRPDVVLSDINMPIMNGFEMLKQIKDNQSLKNIPVIFFSSLGEDEKNIETGKTLGASGFLVKSQLSLGDISKKIREALSIK
jgi:DNA-binding response OmpR family regulator